MKRGLTLLEILVVVGSIAVLNALIFPAFARAKKEAYATTCWSNLHQVGATMNMYAEDHSGGYPLTDVSPLFSYAGNKEVFRCPEDDIGISGMPRIRRGTSLITYTIPFDQSEPGPAPGVDAWRLLAEADSNHGLVYCFLHGEPRLAGPNDKFHARTRFKGRIAVVLKDGSVHWRRSPMRRLRLNLGYSVGGRCAWEILTQLAMPRGVCTGSTDGYSDMIDGEIVGD